MVAILENPEVRQLVHKISVWEYEQLGEIADGTRTELIRGILLEKRMPPSGRHSFLITWLYKRLLAAAGTTAFCRQEQPLKLRDSMPQPDLAVVAGQEEDYPDAHPSTALLVVEIAITSRALDREKAALYAEAEIGEYWILLGGEKAVEVHTKPEAGVYTERRMYLRDQLLVSGMLPALRVDLGALFNC